MKISQATNLLSNYSQPFPKISKKINFRISNKWNPWNAHYENAKFNFEDLKCS